MLIQDVKAAMRLRIQSATWLDNPTRAEAWAKLEKVAEEEMATRIPGQPFPNSA